MQNVLDVFITYEKRICQRSGDSNIKVDTDEHTIILVDGVENGRLREATKRVPNSHLRASKSHD